MNTLAVIGGTGLEQLEGFAPLQSHVVSTPYGAPSGPIQEGVTSGATVFFLHRHGHPRTIAPHKINYRANVWALRSLGVDAVVAVNAVGGISKGMQPGRLLIPHQLIDYTWGREHTFDEGNEEALLHIEFTEPYAPALRRSLLHAARAAHIVCEPAGVHGVTQGPRLETAAEITRLARDGCDVVGMTGMPEAALAQELGLPYASICIVVNLAAGIGDAPLTTVMMRETLRTEASTVSNLLSALLQQQRSPL